MIDLDVSEVKKFYEEAFQVFEQTRKLPVIKLTYYPYVNINHTIRVRKGKVLIKIADTFTSAPLEIHRALAFILVAKLLNKKVPINARKIYREFISRDEIQQQAFENKKTRGKKIITSPIGDFFNLEGIFTKLNLVYFQDQIPKPILSWSKRRTYRRLGHYDSAHNTIVISKSLDDQYVPKFVVEYVVYHEMLHIKHPVRHQNGRRYIHTPQFKEDERKFPYFDEAEDWIEQNARHLKKKVQRKNSRWFF